jgi:hypothetical protein
LRVYEVKVLRRIFGTNDDGTGGNRRLHHIKLHNLYSSPNITRMTKPRRMMWTEHTACMWEVRNAYKLLAGKPQGKRPFG